MRAPVSLLLAIVIAPWSFAAPATQPAERPATVKVAAIQCPSDLSDIAGNRARLTRLIEDAARNGAKIIVLPETAITGYLSQDLRTNWHLAGWPIEPAFAGKDPAPFAEAVPGPSTEHFAALAKKLGVYITVPLLEVERPRPPIKQVEALDAPPVADPTNRRGDVDGAPANRDAARYFNTVCLVSPRGELVAHYRKLTPWPYPEKSWATPGDRGVQVYDTEYGRVGLAICFDIHTILPKYEPHRIWALLYPIAWVDDAHPADWFWHRLPARTSKYNHWIIGANWSVADPGNGPRPDWFGYGFSTILSPDGKVFATARSLFGEEIVYAEIPTGK